MVCDVVEGDGGMHAWCRKVVHRLGPFDDAAVAHVHVAKGHFEEAHHVGGAVDCHAPRAIGRRRGFWQAEGAADEGRLA